jgi:hypothetical protein
MDPSQRKKGTEKSVPKKRKKKGVLPSKGKTSPGSTSSTSSTSSKAPAKKVTSKSVSSTSTSSGGSKTGAQKEKRGLSGSSRGVETDKKVVKKKAASVGATKVGVDGDDVSENGVQSDTFSYEPSQRLKEMEVFLEQVRKARSGTGTGVGAVEGADDGKDKEEESWQRISMDLIGRHNLPGEILESHDSDLIANEILEITHVFLDGMKIHRMENLECCSMLRNLYLQNVCHSNPI